MNPTALKGQAKLLLSAHPYAGASVEALVSLLGRGERTPLPDGSVLCTEGEKGDSMWVLLQGQIKVLRTDVKGVERVLTVMKAPALVGHMSLVDNSPRSATCAAVGNSILVTLDRRSYNELITSPSREGTTLRRLLLSSLSKQLSGGNERIRDILAPKMIDELENDDAVDLYEDEDFGEDDLAEAAGVLNGWQVDTSGVNSIHLVEDEDTKRNRKTRY